MRYGPFLKDRGTIGYVAPSFGCNIEPYRSSFDHALEHFQKEGYKVLPGPNAYEGSGLGISNTPEKCAAEFMEWYERKDTDILHSCGGGELMCEILPYIDFEKLKKLPPKWFMGYSDNTNLVFLLATICDVAAVYGPCAPTFGMEPWHPALQDAWDLLRGKKKIVTNYDRWESESLKTEDNPLEPYNLTEDFRLHTYVNGKMDTAKEFSFSGRLLGGCMDILYILCGTRFDYVKAFQERYREDGVLWFLESCDLTPLDMRRTLFSLREAGWFETAKGFLIGRPYHFGEELFGADQYNAVTGILGELGVPIVMDVDIGHLPPTMPVVSGSLGTVTVKGNNLKLAMDFV